MHSLSYRGTGKRSLQELDDHLDTPQDSVVGTVEHATIICTKRISYSLVCIKKTRYDYRRSTFESVNQDTMYYHPFPRPQPPSIVSPERKYNDNSSPDVGTEMSSSVPLETVDDASYFTSPQSFVSTLHDNMQQQGYMEAEKQPDTTFQQHSDTLRNIGMWNELSQFQEELRIYLFRRALPSLPGYIKTVITCDLLLLSLYMEKRKQTSKQNIFLDNCYVLYFKLRNGSVVEWKEIIALSFFFHVKDSTGSFLHSYLRVLRLLSTHFYNGALQGVIAQLEGRYYSLYLPHGIFPPVMKNETV